MRSTMKTFKVVLAFKAENIDAAIKEVEDSILKEPKLFTIMEVDDMFDNAIYFRRREERIN